MASLEHHDDIPLESDTQKRFQIVHPHQPKEEDSTYVDIEPEPVKLLPAPKKLRPVPPPKPRKKPEGGAAGPVSPEELPEYAVPNKRRTQTTEQPSNNNDTTKPHVAFE